MTAPSPSRDWTGDDPTSRLLVDLAAGREVSIPLTPDAQLVELAQRHGLVGILSSLTDSHVVRAVHARNRARQEVMLGHLSRLLGLLAGAGIRAVVLKGPAVALQYREPGHRGFSDLDLLVEAPALDQALEVIAGYEAVAGIPERTPKAEKRDIHLADPSGVSFNLDLHWDLFSYTQLRGVAEGAVAQAWSEATPRPDHPLGPTWVLPRPTTLAFLAAHALLDHRFRLILFRDLLEISRHPDAWEGLVEYCRRWRLRSTTHLSLWVAARALGAEVPEALLAELRPESVVTSYLERALPRIDLVSFDGHRPHPVNLACVLLHDRRRDRLVLALRAPTAFPEWRRRVGAGTGSALPRLLVLVSTDRRRGAEVFAARLSSGLITRGWHVEAVSLTSSGAVPRADVEALTDIAPDGVRRLERRIVAALRRRIRRSRPDLLLAFGGSTLRYGVLARLGFGVRLVYASIGEPSYWSRSPRSRLVNRVLLRRVDRILAVSRVTMAQLLDLEPALARKIEVVNTGVPAHFFSIPRDQHEGPLRVLMIGSLSPEKDPISALAVIARSEQARLRLVGGGPMRDGLADEADRLGISSRVELVGAVDDVTPHLAWADVLLLTSRTEGLPGAVLEAAAAGVPAVAFEVGGVGDAIVDGETGFVVPPGAVADMAELLDKLDADRGLITAMGERARRHVAERFALEDVIDGYHSILTGLLPS